VSLALVCACAGRFDAGFFAVASTEFQPSNPPLVSRNVVGRDCGALGSYEEAVANALRSAPGATALVNAKFHYEGRVFGGCAVVIGDAVVLQ
jgi:hypothetical protein